MAEAPSNTRPSGFWQWLKQRRAWVVVGLAVLLVVAVRVRLRDLPLERDEGEYACAGQLILHGVPPYQQVYNMKLPGTYSAYAVIMAVFGQSPSGIHLGLMFVNVGSIILMFLLGRRLLDDNAGVAAAVSYALLSLSQSVLGLMGHATHFVVLPALAGMLVLLKAVEGEVQSPTSKVQSRKAGFTATDCTDFTDDTDKARGSRDVHESVKRRSVSIGLLRIRVIRVIRGKNSLLLLSGILLGLAFLMKQHGLFFGLCGGLYLIWVPIADWLAVESTPWKPRPAFRVLPILRAVGLFTAGLSLPYAFTCLILWRAGVFQQFWFWTVSYASKYASVVSFAEGQGMLRTMLDVVIGPNIALWLLPAAGAVVMWMEPRLSPKSEVQSPKSRVQSPKSERGEGGSPNSRARSPRFLLVALLVCSLGSVGVGFYFRPHYFITLLPVMSLLTGVAVSRSLLVLKSERNLELMLTLPILGLFVFGSLGSVIGNATQWFSLPPDRVLRSTFSSTLFSQARKAAELIKQMDEAKVTSGESKVQGPKSKVTEPESKVQLVAPKPGEGGSPRSGGTSVEEAHKGPKKETEVSESSSVKSVKSVVKSKIAVIGSEPEIYFYTGLPSATGYIYMYPLMEPQPYALKMQEAMVAEIERARPSYVVYVQDNYSWLRRPESEKKLFDWWDAYWAANLELVSTLPIDEGPDDPENVAKPRDPAPAKYLLVLRRKRQ